MRILAGFDVSGHLIGSEINGKTIYHINNLYSFVKRTGASIGIIAVPAPSAQEVCDRMVAAGIRGILNFAPAHLRAPNNVVVRHEDFAVSLALLAVATERTEHAAAISADSDK